MHIRTYLVQTPITLWTPIFEPEKETGNLCLVKIGTYIHDTDLFLKQTLCISVIDKLVSAVQALFLVIYTKHGKIQQFCDSDSVATMLQNCRNSIATVCDFFKNDPLLLPYLFSMIQKYTIIKLVPRYLLLFFLTEMTRCYNIVVQTPSLRIVSIFSLNE